MSTSPFNWHSADDEDIFIIQQLQRIADELEWLIAEDEFDLVRELNGIIRIMEQRISDESLGPVLS